MKTNLEPLHDTLIQSCVVRSNNVILLVYKSHRLSGSAQGKRTVRHDVEQVAHRLKLAENDLTSRTVLTARFSTRNASLMIHFYISHRLKSGVCSLLYSVMPGFLIYDRKILGLS